MSFPSEARQAKRRRLQNLSDEEILERIVDTGVEYRAGWSDTKALPPLPLRTTSDHVRQHIGFHNEQALTAAVMAQLELYHISEPSARFVIRIPRDIDYADEQCTKLTLLITADMESDSHNIKNLILAVRRLLKDDEDASESDIDIIDHRVIDGIYTGAIKNGEIELLTKWRTAEPQVRKLLEATVPNEWLCMEFLRRGWKSRNNDDCKPTIIITTNTARDPKWQTSIIPAIRQLVNYGPDVDVECLFGISLISCGSNASRHVTERLNYGQMVPMGMSIGISTDNHSAGTVGGQVETEDGVVYGLTNWHVVRDERLDKIVKKGKTGYLGPKVAEQNQPFQTIVSPAHSDHSDHMKELSENIETLEEHESRHEGWKRGGSKLEQIKVLKEKFERLKRTERRLGVVTAGSGLRSEILPRSVTDPLTGEPLKTFRSSLAKYSQPFDWALIKVDRNTHPDGRSVECSLPDISKPMVKPYFTGVRPLKDCLSWTIFDNRNDIPVVTFGRTSGWNYGHISPALCVINPKADKEISGTYGYTAQDPGYCFQMFSEDSEGKRTFAIRKGDSGSIVLHDPSAAQLGLCYGLTGTLNAIFTPMDQVFRDIKLVTGKKVIFPEYIQPDEVGLGKYEWYERGVDGEDILISEREYFKRELQTWEAHRVWMQQRNIDITDVTKPDTYIPRPTPRGGE